MNGAEKALFVTVGKMLSLKGYWRNSLMSKVALGMEWRSFEFVSRAGKRLSVKEPGNLPSSTVHSHPLSHAGKRVRSCADLFSS